MKNCPTCQRAYPDDGPDFCPADGTPLALSGSGYDPGRMPGWQQQPPTGWGGYPPPPGQYPPPPPGAGFGGGGYPPPPGQYPPYGYGSATSPAGSAGISKAALFTGIGALGSFILAVLLFVMGAGSGRGTLRDMLPVIGILSLLALLAGLTAVVLGIITVSGSGRNPAMSKVHGILGICFGAIPVLLWFLGLANGSRMRF